MQAPATAGTQWLQRFSVRVDTAQAVYGLATGWTVQGSNSGGGYSALVHTGSGANTASYTMRMGSFPEVKRPGRVVDNPPHLTPRINEE